MSEEKGNEQETKEGDDDDLYSEPKSRPKIIRILTVFAYMSSVSMAAILLSIYYIFMWEGQPSLARRTDPRMESIVGHSSFIQKELIFEHNKSTFEEISKKHFNLTFNETENDNNNSTKILANVIDINQDIQDIEDVQNDKDRNLNEPIKDVSGGNCTNNN